MKKYWVALLLGLVVCTSAFGAGEEKALLQVFSKLPGAGNYPELIEAQREAAWGEDKKVLASLKKLQARLPSNVSSKEDLYSHPELIELMRNNWIDQNPVQARRLITLAISRLRSSLLAIESAERARRDQSMIDGFFSPFRNSEIDQADDQVDHALVQLQNWIDENDTPSMKAYFNERRNLQYVLASFTDALLNRWASIDGRAQLVDTAVNAFFQDSRFSIDAAKASQLIEQEQGESLLRIYINRQTISTTALSLTLIAQAISVPFTFGGSTAAMPDTVSALVAALNTGANTLYVTVGSLELWDRFASQGLRAWTSQDTYFEILMIVNGLPKSAVGELKNYDWYKKLEQAKNAANVTSTLVTGTEAIWNFAFADGVARAKGKTAAAVRIQSINTLTMQLISAWQNKVSADAGNPTGTRNMAGENQALSREIH